MKGHDVKLSMAAAVAAFFIGAPAIAAPVNYNEAADGDLGFPGFTLDAGTNTITGTAARSDVDSFGLLFGSGLEIVGGSFTATNTGGNGNYNSSAELIVGGGIFQGVLGSGTTDISFLPGIDSGSVFRVSANSTSDIAYTFTFEVSPVPLPASGLLLLGALGGAAALRRRKQRG